MRNRPAIADGSSTTGSRTSARSLRPHEPQGARGPRRRLFRSGLAILLLMITARCTKTGPNASAVNGVTLRIGFGLAATASTLNGIAQVTQLFTREGLARMGEDGRPTP